MHSLLANVRQFPLIAVAAVLLLLCIVVSLFIAPIWLAFGLMLVLATLVAALIKSHTAEELSEVEQAFDATSAETAVVFHELSLLVEKQSLEVTNSLDQIRTVVSDATGKLGTSFHTLNEKSDEQARA